ncbi:hypothetical protein SLEP1_g53113 [Rubroshorea leprosula]|uniref:Uncharacterized protein n=1 Tax=Rubroshorea leprosula TaxID=152421 RepID=A0AAV5MBW0_9ROSI|nr:hypothetical protein SLEP1_g53113 [Rubroshorea leprosula]
MAMALAAQVREWIEFPPATQSKLLELIGKLDQEVPHVDLMLIIHESVELAKT